MHCIDAVGLFRMTVVTLWRWTERKSITLILVGASAMLCRVLQGIVGASAMLCRVLQGIVGASSGAWYCPELLRSIGGRC